MADLERMAESLSVGQGIDPETGALIESSRKRLLNTTPAIIDKVGTDKVGNDFTELKRRNSAMGGGDNSIYEALRQRNEARTGDLVGAMTRDVQMMAPVREATGLAQVGQNYRTQAGFDLKRNQVEMQKEANKFRVKMYRQQQQDALLGGILGIVGTIGGIALGAVTGGAGLGLLGAAKGAGAATAGGMAKGALSNIA
jgi:hypothetical protein